MKLSAVSLLSCLLYLCGATTSGPSGPAQPTGNPHAALDAEIESLQHLKPDANGYYRKDIDYKTPDGKYHYKLHFLGKYRSTTYVHALDNDHELDGIECTKRTIRLSYASPAAASSVLAKIQSVLSKAGEQTDCILSGSFLYRCPNAIPPELEKDRETGKKVSASHFAQTFRRINVAELDSTDSRTILLKTSFATIADVFWDLEYDGESNIIDPQAVNVGQDIENMNVQVNQDDDEEEKDDDIKESIVFRPLNLETDEDGILRPVAATETEEDEDDDSIVVKAQFFKALAKAVKKTIKKVGDVVMNVGKKIVNGVKKVVQVVVDVVTMPFKACSTKNGVSAGQCALSILDTILNAVPKIIGAILPPLVDVTKSASNSGTSFNYDSVNKKALQVWTINQAGFHFGPIFKVGKSTSIAVFISGKLTCLNCFLRFYNGVVTWNLKIGGGTTIRVGLTQKFDVEFMLELLATIKINLAVIQSIAKVPIPKLGARLPDGSVVGLYLHLKCAVGVGIQVTDLYYKYHSTGWQQFGISYAWLEAFPRVTRNGHMTSNSVGPVVKGGASAEFFILPILGLEFNGMAAIEAGLKPTFKFTLTPAPRSTGCYLKYSIGFDIPLVLGAWVGIPFPAGTLRLAGWSQSFSFLNIPPLASGCVAKTTVDVGNSLFAGQVPATVYVPNGVAKVNFPPPIRPVAPAPKGSSDDSSDDMEEIVDADANLVDNAESVIDEVEKDVVGGDFAAKMNSKTMTAITVGSVAAVAGFVTLIACLRKSGKGGAKGDPATLYGAI